MSLPGAEIIERAGIIAWPALETEYDGSWVRRAANNYTHRANSVQSLNPADDGTAPARLKAAVEWFDARGVDPVFRVTPLCGVRVREALTEGGWTSFDHSFLSAMELGSTAADPRGEVVDPNSYAFLAAQKQLRGYDDAKLAKLLAIIQVLEVPARGVLLRDADGAVVASALMSVAEGIVITGNVVTDATRRRQGFGAAMMRTGLAWAHAEGATVAALNVAANNAAGQALYSSLGYAEQYEYHYQRPPGR